MNRFKSSHARACLVAASLAAASSAIAAAPDRLPVIAPATRVPAADPTGFGLRGAIVPMNFAGLDRVEPGRFAGPAAAAPDGWNGIKIVQSDGQENDLFGFRVLMDGDTAFVSAPAPIYRPGKVYVFTNIDGVWTETQQIVPTPESEPPPGWSDFFGWSLSRSGDDLLVGAPFAFDTMMGPIGAAYVFQRSGDQWMQTAELTADMPVSTDYFGWSVAIAGDTALIGANSHNRGAEGTEGAAYVFDRAGGTWSQSQLLEPSDGTPGDGHSFGGAVEFDGTTMLIGAAGPDYASDGVYPQGSAYVFTQTGGAWTEAQRLTASDGALADQFGFALALDGTRALIGSPAADIGANAHQGAVYVFDSDGGNWSESGKLTVSDGEAYDQLGQSVALLGDTALAGMWSRDDDPNDPPPPAKQGSVYLFDASLGSGNETGVLTADDGEPGDSFGWDVDFDGATIAVGAQGTVAGNMYQGAAYLYSQADDTIFSDGFDIVPL